MKLKLRSIKFYLSERVFAFISNWIQFNLLCCCCCLAKELFELESYLTLSVLLAFTVFYSAFHTIFHSLSILIRDSSYAIVLWSENFACLIRFKFVASIRMCTHTTGILLSLLPRIFDFQCILFTPFVCNLIMHIRSMLNGKLFIIWIADDLFYRLRTKSKLIEFFGNHAMGIQRRKFADVSAHTIIQANSWKVERIQIKSNQTNLYFMAYDYRYQMRVQWCVQSNKSLAQWIIINEFNKMRTHFSIINFHPSLKRTFMLTEWWWWWRFRKWICCCPIFFLVS